VDCLGYGPRRGGRAVPLLVNTFTSQPTPQGFPENSFALSVSLLAAVGTGVVAVSEAPFWGTPWDERDLRVDRVRPIRKGFGQISRRRCRRRPSLLPQTSMEMARGMDQNWISVCSPM
jgi:hypothetical protein